MGNGDGVHGDVSYAYIRMRIEVKWNGMENEIRRDECPVWWTQGGERCDLEIQDVE
jgi:hypothetical protein